MTQLARPDLARNRSERDDVRPGPASGTTELLPVGRSRLVRAGQPIPGWAVGTASLTPVVLVGGWLIAGALQPASYSPMRQTMSVLAGQSGTDRWVMTATLLLVGSCQIATGAGLLPSACLRASCGPDWHINSRYRRHSGTITGRRRATAFAVSCVITTAVWPVLVARRASHRGYSVSTAA
jgi:hypothetical protein